MKLHHLAVAMAALSFVSPMVCYADNGSDAGGGGGKTREKPEAKSAEAPATADQATSGQGSEAAPAGDTTLTGGDASDVVVEDTGPEVPGVAKLRHPDGATSCSHGGHEYTPDDKGIFRVPVIAVEDLTSHGLILVGGE